MYWNPIEAATEEVKASRILGYGHKVYPAAPNRKDSDYFIAWYEDGRWMTEDTDVDTREVILIAYAILTPPIWERMRDE